MITENLQRYAYYMMFINLAFLLLNIAGIFQVSMSVAGFDAIEEMNDTFNGIKTKFEAAGNSLEYVLVVGFMLIEGVKLIILFIIMVFTGLAVIFELLGVPALMYGPIVTVIDAVILYDFAKMLLKIG